MGGVQQTPFKEDKLISNKAKLLSFLPNQSPIFKLTRFNLAKMEPNSLVFQLGLGENSVTHTITIFDQQDREQRHE